MSTSKRLQIGVSDHLLHKLNEESARRGLKPTELVRLLISDVCARDTQAREVVNAK